MKLNARTAGSILLLLGIILLAVAFYSDNTLFSWISAGCLAGFLLLRGRRPKPRGK
jgi:hypothetical protein